MIYCNSANERKAQSKAFDSYNHLKTFLSDNYDNLTDDELNNMIHNVEQMATIVDHAPMELIAPLVEKQMQSRIDYLAAAGIYPKL